MITWERKIPGSTRFVYLDIPDTSREWELYESKPGVDKCVDRLVAAVARACKEFDNLRRGEYPNIRSAMKVAFNNTLDVFDKESEFGAADSGPLCKAEEIFCNYVRAVTGVDYYCVE